MPTRDLRPGFARAALAGILALVSIPVPFAAQDDQFEDWRRSDARGADDMEREFRDSVAEQEREFREHLRTQWREFQVFTGKVRDRKPKPAVLPVAPVAMVKPSTRPTVKPQAAVPGKSVAEAPRKPVAPQPEIPVTELPKKPSAAPKPAAPDLAVDVPARPPVTPRPTVPDVTVEALPKPPVAPRPAVAPKPSVPDVSAERVPPAPVPVPTTPAPERPVAITPPAKLPAVADALDLDFYGTPLRIPFDARWRTPAAVESNPKGFADFWDRMSATRDQPSLDAVAQARKAMALDDWGNVLLWQEVAKTLRPAAPREQLLLLWYFLVKSGVDVRPGYSDERLLLLLAVKQPVYGVSYVKIDNRAYYALFEGEGGKSGGRYSAYSGRYPNELRPVDIRVAATAFGPKVPTQRTFEFDARGRRIRLDVAYERPLTQYLDRFPQLDFELYFATPPSPLARRSLLDALRPHLQGLDQEAGVDVLLAFVQKSFAYKTDNDQFGREKYFFVEEVLHFPFSDCEDRSALFAWLTRELLGLETVGLHYPGHMTTAVALRTTRPEWQTVEWSGRRYVIADPTYVNATVGMAMPSYRGKAPLRVVALR